MDTVLFIATVITVFSTIDAGFIGNFPCSDANTLYYPITQQPRSQVKCLDITKIDPLKIRGLQNKHKNADTLYADGMRLRRVPKTLINTMPKLKEIDLSRNKFKKLDKLVFTSCHNLEKVLLHKNQISFIPNEPFLVSKTITDLVLSDNQIAKISKKTFSHLPKLQRLFVDGNKLTVLEPNSFNYLLNLRYLNIARNCIEDVPEKRHISKALVKIEYKNQCSPR